MDQHGNVVGPSFWGPHSWNLIHSVAVACDDVYLFNSFIHSLGAVLPCSVCRNGFDEEIRNLQPLELYARRDTSTGIFMWTYDLHNLIDRRSGKPPRFSNAQDAYNSVRSSLENREWLYSMWLTIHSVAVSCNTLASMEKFAKFVNFTFAALPSDEIRNKLTIGACALGFGSVKEYMTKLPVQGAFMWSYQLHNLYSKMTALDRCFGTVNCAPFKKMYDYFAYHVMGATPRS